MRQRMVSLSRCMPNLKGPRPPTYRFATGETNRPKAPNIMIFNRIFKEDSGQMSQKKRFGDIIPIHSLPPSVQLNYSCKPIGSRHHQ